MRSRQPRAIGPAVRDYRTRLGLTQHQVAELADVAPETVSRIERNRIAASLDLTRRIAAALHVGVDDLLAAKRPIAVDGALRPADRRLLMLVRGLDEPQVDDVARALRTLFGVASLLPSHRRSSRR